MLLETVSKVSCCRRRCQWQKEAQDPGKKRWVSGCRSLGQFLCYELNCVQCAEVAKKRSWQLFAPQRKRRSTFEWNSPSSSCCRRCVGRRVQIKLLPQNRGRTHQEPEALEPLVLATAQPSVKLHSQADELAGPGPLVLDRNIGHQASSPITPVSHPADEGGGHPLGVSDPLPMLTLERGKEFMKRLEGHMWRKCKQIRLGTLPALVQQSQKSSAHRTVPHELLNTGSVTFSWFPDNWVLPKKAQEVLELHLIKKKLHHDGHLPAKSPGSVPGQHHSEVDGQLHRAPWPCSGEPEVEEDPHLPLRQSASTLVLSQVSPKSMGGRTEDGAVREAAAGHQDSSRTQGVLQEGVPGSRSTGEEPGKKPSAAGWHREPAELGCPPSDCQGLRQGSNKPRQTLPVTQNQDTGTACRKSLDTRSRMRVLHQGRKAITFLMDFAPRPVLLKRAVYRILGLHRLYPEPHDTTHKASATIGGVRTGGGQAWRRSLY
nr:uncharacterized protein LOC110357018 isoform X2 [Columba livia]